MTGGPSAEFRFQSVTPDGITPADRDGAEAEIAAKVVAWRERQARLAAARAERREAGLAAARAVAAQRKASDDDGG